MIPLTVEQVSRVTGAAPADAEKFLPYLQGTCKAFDITSPKRIVGFLSQIGHESQGLRKLEESLNYSTERLLAMFGPHRITVEQARKFGRRPGQAANPEGIANAVYGGEWGRQNLGNTQPGDGYRYRGRGLKQLTGRRNYQRCGLALNEDFVNHPERLLMPVNAALSAGWFWESHGLNKAADRGDVIGMTRIINGGTNGLDQRMALWRTGMEVFA